MHKDYGKFCWYELMTTDVAAAERFYSSVVGWETRDSGMEGMNYTLAYAGDLTSAWDFYSKTFGWTKDVAVDMSDGGMGVYQTFAVRGGDAIGGMMTNPPGSPAPPYWGYYFVVEGLDAAGKRVTDGGGSIVMGPMEVPGGAWILNCIDPQGAYFSLVSMTR